MGPTSIKIFRKHLRLREDGSVDASLIHSQACFLEWNSQHADNETITLHQAKKFQRVLSNHLTGVDGRVPFHPWEEMAILDIIRKKKTWPCFEGLYAIGSSGFRALGFHEKLTQHSHASSSDQSQPGVKRTKHDILTPPQAVREELRPLPPPSNSSFKFGTAESSGEDLFLLSSQLEDKLNSVSLLPDFVVDLEVWKMAFSKAIMFLVARMGLGSFTRLSLEEKLFRARQLSLIHSKVPAEFVLVFSVSEPYDRRILAQNVQSHVYFGSVAGHFSGKLVQGVEVIRIFLTAGTAFRNPGRSFELDIHLGLDSTLAALYHVHFTVDPDSNLLVVSGVPKI